MIVSLGECIEGPSLPIDTSKSECGQLTMWRLKWIGGGSQCSCDNSNKWWYIDVWSWPMQQLNTHPMSWHINANRLARNPLLFRIGFSFRWNFVWANEYIVSDGRGSGVSQLTAPYKSDICLDMHNFVWPRLNEYRFQRRHRRRRNNWEHVLDGILKPMRCTSSDSCQGACCVCDSADACVFNLLAGARTPKQIQLPLASNASLYSSHLLNMWLLIQVIYYPCSLQSVVCAIHIIC